MRTPKSTLPSVVTTTEQLCQRVRAFVGNQDGNRRAIIAIAGPPGAGKSTLLSFLINSLQKEFGSSRVVGVPMDGFHLDNVQLDSANTRARKGAPHTFDVGGVLSLVQRLTTDESPIYAPEFDRAGDLARNCAIKIDQEHDVVLIEGNYLLLDQLGWRELSQYFNLTINIDVPDEILEERLVRRWLDHGLSKESALSRAMGNDIPNAVTVREESLVPDIIYRPENP